MSDIRQRSKNESSSKAKEKQPSVNSSSRRGNDGAGGSGSSATTGFALFLSMAINVLVMAYAYNLHITSSSSAVSTGLVPHGVDAEALYEDEYDPTDYLALTDQPPLLATGAPDINRKFYFFHYPNQNGVHYYRKILIGSGWTESRNWDEIVKTKHPVFTFLTRAPSVWKTKYSFFKEGRHIVNHFPGDRVPFNKEPFMMHLRQWGLVTGCDYTQVHPETFRLHDPQECEEVLKIEEAEFEQREDNMWFTKILEGTFGIGVIPVSLAELRRTYTRGTNMSEPITDPEVRKNICIRWARKIKRKRGLLLQRAVMPFLTEGRKFDIRTHLLIANFKPFYVFYNAFSPYLRRSTSVFDPNSANKAGSVTNSHFQMHEEGFDPLDHLWGMHTDFRDYVLSQGYTEEQFHEIFHVQMKKLQLALFHSFKNHVNRANGYYLILGVDVIVDENMHLSILEANTNPAMRYDVDLVGTEALQRFWTMAHESTSLVWEIYSKTNNPQRKYNPLKWRSAKHYQLLYTDDPKLDKPWQYSDDMCFQQTAIYEPPNPPTPWRGARHKRK